jgi:hypothetical protein
MATPTYEIWCLIEGSAPFPITAPYNALIRKVKGLIRERLKNGILRNVDARNLTLTKVKVRHIASSVKSLAIPTTWISLVSHRAGWSLKHTKIILMLANPPNWNMMMSLAHGNLLTKYG